MKMKGKIFKVVCMCVISVVAVTLLSQKEAMSEKSFAEGIRDTIKYLRDQGSVEFHSVTVPHTAGMDAGTNVSVTQGSNEDAILDGYVQGLAEQGLTDKQITEEVNNTFMGERSYSATAITISIEKAKAAVQPQDTTASEPVLETAVAVVTEVMAEQTQAEQTQAKPTMPANERVAEGIAEVARPRGKFAKLNSSLWSGRQTDTAQKMLAEGYSATEIAQGFKANYYSTDQIARIFKQAGVGVKDAYTALSTVALAEVKANVEQQKPGSKFRSIIFRVFRQVNPQHTELTAAKQDALKGITQELIDAGYDLQPALPNIVSDMKANGMTAQETFKVLIGHVYTVDTTGQRPFKNFKINPQQTTFGNGDVALASAMFGAGYFEAEITSAFQNKNGIFYGEYSYSDNTINQLLQQAKPATSV